MSKCKCKCQCCRPGPSYEEARSEIHDAMIDKRVRSAIIISDEEWDAYHDGLRSECRFKDSQLWEAGVNSLMYHSQVVISQTEYGNWRARKR